MKEAVNPIIILGSSRSDGATLRAVKAVVQERDVPLVDLKNLNISYFDYDSGNRHDDFIPLIEKMVKCDLILLATPVYWYSMSAIMKTFIDRFSDLLYVRKDLGKLLKGKRLGVITSYGTDMPRGFEDAFSQTCDYLGMSYEGCFYYYSGNDLNLRDQNEALAEKFRNHTGL